MSKLSGQTVAIVGPTGAGKTTIINLLVNFMTLLAVILKLMALIYVI